MRKLLAILCTLSMLLLASCQAAHPVKPKADGSTFRVATFNASLYSTTAGGLVQRLQAGDEKARQIAAVIQHQRPDLLLINEFDYDPGHVAADLFQRRYLEVDQFGEQAIAYPFRYLAPVNTGEPSGMDLDRNGSVGGGNDAYGFGQHPGQYGMLVLSRFPIDAAAVRSFQKLLWKDLPGATSPVDPASNETWYPAQVWSRLRLSSKSHWDVPVQTPAGTLHFLVHHPTPPVFDGPEDRNGLRNRDEIRLWVEYISAANQPWLCDDQGRCGGLPGDALFVIAGDHNADPFDGESAPRAIAQLLEHPRVRDTAPGSAGAVAAALAAGGSNLAHRGPAAHDTGSFGPRVGNLRVDYVLPSVELNVIASGVFWPLPGERGADWLDATDHHLVWVDISP